eukprot:7183441-Pyramimonas_sp.AAC.1
MPAAKSRREPATQTEKGRGAAGPRADQIAHRARARHVVVSFRGLPVGFPWACGGIYDGRRSGRVHPGCGVPVRRFRFLRVV